jgi:hypothetical protein
MAKPFYLVFIALIILISILQISYEGPKPMNVFEFMDWLRGDQ